MPRHLSFLGATFFFACSSTAPTVTGTPDAGPGGSPDAGLVDAGQGVSTPDATPTTSTTQDETWTDGKSIGSSVVIEKGVTVTIAAGASITIAAGASIQVNGALNAKSSGANAKLSGSGWAGIVVAGGGSLAMDGVDISGATLAIDVQNGGTATFNHGAIAGTPFKVEKGGTLSTMHATVTGPTARSNIAGSFTASYLDYDENDQHAIWAMDPTATLFIEDSTFHNSGPLGSSSAPDVLTVAQAASFHIAYSDVSGAHCGFHFEGGGVKIEIDHVTVRGVTNGADIWGTSATGAHTITSSNFEQLSEALDESGTNGQFTVTSCYLTGTNNLQQPSAVTIASAASAEIATAHPR
jgi:hypothetical protein